MCVDPALVLATLAHQFAACDFTRAQLSHPLTLFDLADFWCRQGSTLWRTTDWLACPSTHATDSTFTGFDRLDHYFQTLPLSRWPGQAESWWAEAGGHRPEGDFSKVRLMSSDDQPEASRSAHEVIARLIDRCEPNERLASYASASVDRIKSELAHSLAYGLSHEINNPLANISTRAQSLARVIDEPSQRQSLLRIVDQTSRAHAMIADLMFYANPPEPKWQSFDLKDCLNRTLSGFTDEAQRCSIATSVLFDSDEEAQPVHGDVEMIGEAVAVLVRNAIEAIGIDGVVQVRVTRSEHRNNNTNNGCRIRVCDSGPGLTPEQAARAFDPYYSGREAGRGLGLGLCRAQRIMELHGGSVSIEPALAGCVATLVW
ncbi:Sensor protein ZraS [Neorhodopirellula pilleata]|uniref:histidine kinase n=2 Tax=Neorhodopirellula pilleata TaxID=2714738 RepID=A0A5C6ASK9_9BACT|nr:Sensor protein ZraS [Neorhodopirellula pilleata]